MTTPTLHCYFDGTCHDEGGKWKKDRLKRCFWEKTCKQDCYNCNEFLEQKKIDHYAGTVEILKY